MCAIIQSRLKREAIFVMMIKKMLKIKLVKFVFGIFLMMIGMFGGMIGTTINSEPVFAEPVEQTEVITDDAAQPTVVQEVVQGETEAIQKVSVGDSCKSSLGAIGWLVCPTTGKIAEAVDWLYEKIENILVINPVPAENGSPIYEIWKYCRGLTNIVFIIFLLVVIYSQLTGLGISNYGVKKALPKLIVAAIMVNLSFLICSLAVDLSNVIGNGLRGVFTSIAESAMVGGTSGLTASGDLTREMKMSYAGMYSSLAGGTALAVGAGTIAFEMGAIWMLIPTVLGAIVAVATGLITIALRQAVVALLIMVSPLAMVANILPNTEQWFKKWKDLLYKMLIFYPMFSLLFGASQLAGFAIIASAKDGFGLMLGMAVQIFPLFFSWKLMQMSGTFLGNINAKIRGFAAAPVASSRAWAESRRQLSKQKHLASGNAYSPSLRLMQFMSNRRIAKEAELSEYSAEIKERGLAYRAKRNYVGGNVDDMLSKKGRNAYASQARVMEYRRISLRDKNNFNKGFGYRAKEGTVIRRQLDTLDNMNVVASDMLKVEQARGEKIEYDNAVSYHERMEAAMNVHMDEINGFEFKKKEGKFVLDENGNKILVQKAKYKFHFDPNNLAKTAEMARYNAMSQIMEGNEVDVQFAAASAAQAYDTQKKIIETKMQKYFELAPPTQDVVYRLAELTKNAEAIKNIDSIIPGLRILNQRGDTDLLRQQMTNVLNQGLDLGTHASQALASFLMFEVKDNDPWLRRFGKYINLETANVFNENKRQEMKVTYDEYIKGYHKEPDGKLMYAKKPMAVLMEGTSLDGIERTALANFDDSLIEAYTYIGDDGGKHLKVAEYLKKREEIQKSIGPQFISASLKYLSGSEQLKNAVSFLTGYSYSQVKNEDGSTMLDENDEVVYEWKARWGKGGDLSVDNPKLVQKYFREKALKYFEDQTPAQILGLRSDYRDPLMEHLSEAYLEKHSEEKSKYQAKVDEIEKKYSKDYSDAKTNEERKMAKKERKRGLEKLKMNMAGKQVRKILGESGKLEQIYRTRRSGAANNAKDWLREWLNLDNEEALFREVKYYQREKNEQQRREEKTEVGDSGLDDSTRIYNSAKRKEFRDSLERLWEDSEDGIGADEFYNEAIRALKVWFGESTETLIEKEFKKGYERRLREGHPEAYDLKKDLEDLLMDPDNYPDA